MKTKLSTNYLLLIMVTGSFFLQQCNNQTPTSETAIKVETDTITTIETVEVNDSIVTEPTQIIPDTTLISKKKDPIKKETKQKEKVKEKEKVKIVQAPLTLIITNLASATAPVIVGLYGTTNDFPNPKDQLKEYKFKAKGNQLTAKITDLKFGTYAIALYQDENSDGKIGKNLIGIPTERYAFSNNYKPTIKAPSFDNCKFEYTAETHTLNITMLK